jgi:hypothetical protein
MSTEKQERIAGPFKRQIAPFEGDELLIFEGEERKNATRFFIKGTEPSTYKFDGTIRECTTFMEIIYDKAQQFHWTNIIYIEDDDDIPRSVIFESDLLTYENVRDHARDYQDMVDRRTQNAYMMYYCIIDSLEPRFKAIVMQYSARYSIFGRRNGPMLLKQIFDLLPEEDDTVVSDDMIN